MNDNLNHELGDRATNQPSESTATNGVGSTKSGNLDLAAQCQRLREQNEKLEKERDLSNMVVQKLQEDYRFLHRAYWSEVKKQYTDEELRKMAEMPDLADCLPLSAFLHELEEIVQGEDDE